MGFLKVVCNSDISSVAMQVIFWGCALWRKKGVGREADLYSPQVLLPQAVGPFASANIWRCFGEQRNPEFSHLGGTGHEMSHILIGFC